MIKKIFLLSLFIILMGVVSICYLVFYYAKDLPDFRQLAEYNPPTVTRLYSQDNKLIEEYAKEHRIYVQYDDIPKLVINAFLSAEDKNFFSHPGIDFYSVVRAIVQNIINISQQKSLVGGSTITQQVVKNFLLTNERSLSRKIKEAILSFRISQVYSKERILELYLNQIYLGSGSYGIASAAQKYFSKNLNELTIEEATFLAALPKAPSNYDPIKNPQKSVLRRNYVIERMLDDDLITKEQAEYAYSTSINLKKRDDAHRTQADYFAEEVRKYILSHYGEKSLYEDGLQVKTTLDPELQKYATIALQNGLMRYDRKHGFRGAIANINNIDNWQQYLKSLPKITSNNNLLYGAVLDSTDKAIILLRNGNKITITAKDISWAKKNIKATNEVLNKGDVILLEKTDQAYELRQIPKVSGAIVVMNPHNGNVLAMTGGFDFNISKFNRASQALRQPGSTFKPFVYLSALENNIPPNTVINDGPVEIYQGPGLPMWRPKNYKGDFLGDISMRAGLEKSRNLVTIRVAQKVGIKKIMEITKRFGINAHPQENFSMVLGASETTVLNLTNAYAMIANGGKKISPKLVEYITNNKGDLIEKSDMRECLGCNLEADYNIEDATPPIIEDNTQQVTDPESAYQLISMLEGAVIRGTGQKARILGQYIAGKTGTTNQSFDTWFMGFTSDLVVGVYVGYDTPKSLGSRETGASLALPIFVDFMTPVIKIHKPKPFTVPQNIKFIATDSLTGSTDISNTAPNKVAIEAFKINNITNQDYQEDIDGDQESDDNDKIEPHNQSDNFSGFGTIY
jgi:penicillin-binding protein 1A